VFALPNRVTYPYNMKYLHEILLALFPQQIIPRTGNIFKMLTMLYVFIPFRSVPSRPDPTHNVNIPRLQDTCGMKRGRQELLIMTWGEG